jgi:large subunit ribosomal protein L10
MPLSKEKKQQFVADVADKLTRSKAVVFTDYRGLTVEEIEEVRNNLRQKGIEYKVIKNTLFLRALDEAKISIDTSDFEGHPIAAAFAFDDEVEPAKITCDYAKKNEKLEILGGILEGKEMNAITIKSLAKLPGRDELYAKIVGSLASPLSGTVNVLAANIRNLVNVLNNYNESRSQ